MNLRTLLFLSLLLPCGVLMAADQQPATSTVTAVDPNRYAGTWYEIARLPMFFQRKCVRDVTATYTRKDGYVAVGGGWPDFAFLAKEAGDRYLVCSRCNSQWLYRRLGCPFCDTQDDAKIVYYPSEDQVYRLYVCDACHRYLKTMDLRQTAASVLAVVERITTVAMDMTARQEGYQ